MTLDLATMMAFGVLATAIAGALTLTAWFADRAVGALLWWAAGYFANAIGIGFLLVAHGDPDNLWTPAAAVMLSLGPALIWTGARLLADRPLVAALLVAGPLVTIAAGIAAAITGRPNVLMIAQFAGPAAYLVLAIAALWRFPKAGLRSAVALIAFLSAHSAVFAVGLIEALLDILPQRGLLGFQVLFSIIHFEQLVFAMGSSIFLVALVRERSEMSHKAAAAIDDLTGLATRGAFMEKAQRELALCVERDAPLTLMMFDLDHFKSINDNHGHAAGDEVLRAFAQIARGCLRANDVIGRLGGEEFAAIMPGSNPASAKLIANRIRCAFADCQVVSGGHIIQATVSGGVAAAQSDGTLEQLLSAADRALYCAKAKGRNRVEIDASAGGSPNGKPFLVRVA